MRDEGRRREGGEGKGRGIDTSMDLTLHTPIVSPLKITQASGVL